MTQLVEKSTDNKYCLFPDEWYPVITLIESDFEPESRVTIPADKVDWINATFKEFKAVQNYLKELK